jgi:hypothetical protein
MMRRRIYLRVGDRVRHIRRSVWGPGEVVEERHSSLEGGICLVKILFEDGEERFFINDMESDCCCCYAGVRLLS